LSWGVVSGVISYNVQVFNSSAVLLGTYNTTTNNYNATGLTASTAYSFKVQSVCASGSSAYSTSASFTTTSTTVTCGTPTGLSSSAIAQTTATVSWSAVSGATAYNVQYKPTSATSFSSVTTTTTSRALTGLTAGTAYVYQIQSVCAGGNSVVSAQGTFTTLSGTVTYCSSKGTSQSDEWIDRVSLNALTRTSASDAGYIYFTTTSAAVTAGRAYSLGYSAGFRSGYTATEFWRVWIDYNQNGVFTDAGELVVSTSSASASNLSTSITIPATAKNGTTRMRVSMKWNSAQTSSCELFSYGEVEDYNVVISGGTNREIGPSPEPVEEKVSHDAMVYPNPAHSRLVIETSASFDLKNASFQLIDMQGKSWKRESTTIQNNDLENVELNVENLPNGLYNLLIFSGDAKISKKILVLHP